jgi:hypothetical protein
MCFYLIETNLFDFQNARADHNKTGEFNVYSNLVGSSLLMFHRITKKVALEVHH